MLGLAAAASYAATPDGLGTTSTSRWQSVMTRLRRLQEDRRGRRNLRAARAREAIAQAAVRQLSEELAVLVPQVFAAEQAALLFWRYQVAIGDAAQRGFEQHLAAYSMRRSRGVWRPITDWWRGAPPVVPDANKEVTSVAGEQSDWADQVARVTMAAKRVLVRRGLLDITHGLRVPQPTARPPAYPTGTPAGPGGNGAEAVVTDGDRPSRTGGHDHHSGTLARADEGG